MTACSLQKPGAQWCWGDEWSKEQSISRLASCFLRFGHGKQSPREVELRMQGLERQRKPRAATQVGQGPGTEWGSRRPVYVPGRAQEKWQLAVRVGLESWGHLSQELAWSLPLFLETADTKSDPRRSREKYPKLSGLHPSSVGSTSQRLNPTEARWSTRVSLTGTELTRGNWRMTGVWIKASQRGLEEYSSKNSWCYFRELSRIFFFWYQWHFHKDCESSILLSSFKGKSDDFVLRGRNKVTWTSSLGNWVFRSQLTLSRYKQATVKSKVQEPREPNSRSTSALTCSVSADKFLLLWGSVSHAQLTCSRSPLRRKKSPAPEAEAFSIMGDGWLNEFTWRKIMQTNVSCKTPGSISKMMKMQWWGLIINACWDGRENQGPGVGTAVWEAEERLWEEGWGAWQLEVGKSQARLLGHTRPYFRASLNKPLFLSGPQCPQRQNEGAEQIISVAPGTSVSTSIRSSIRRGKAEE